VSYATANGTATAPQDYVAASGMLTFTPGQTSRTFTVAVAGDVLDEDNETFQVNLTGAVNAGIGRPQAVATITDNDAAPSMAIGNATVAEGNSGSTTATFTVTMSPASGRVVTVNYATANGTATAGSDYTATSGTLTFAPGVTSQTIPVTVLGDTAIEANETFTVNLTGAVNVSVSDSQGLGTINNDEVLPTLSIGSVSATEGNSGTKEFVFTVTLSAASSQTVTVNYATANGTANSTLLIGDYVAENGSLSFAPGVTTRTVGIAVRGNTTGEADETFFVDLSGASGATIATARGTGTIVNDD
jgi:hypothetical protein